MTLLCEKLADTDPPPHRLAYLCKNDWWGATPSPWNFGSNWPRWSEIADFQSIFARSASAV